MTKIDGDSDGKEGDATSTGKNLESEATEVGVPVELSKSQSTGVGEGVDFPESQSTGVVEDDVELSESEVPGVGRGVDFLESEATLESQPPKATTMPDSA